jgi:O-antigen/teichoic acid export membrane protein
MVGVEAIGIASSITAFVDILSIIIIFDMSLGMKRPLGISVSSGNYGRFKQVLGTTVILVSSSVIISTVLLLLPSLNLLGKIGFDPEYFWVIIVMLPFVAFRYVFSEALIAALRSGELIRPFLYGSIIRFPIFFIVAYLFAAPIFGTIIGYFSMIVMTSICFALSSIEIFRGRSHVSTFEKLSSTAKTVLTGSLASWIPHVLNILGIQLGILTTLSIAGAVEAGKFYLPMGIFTVALFIVMGISKVTHSLVSSITTIEKQAEFLSYTMKVAFLFTMPVATPLLFYSYDYLGIIGPEFSTAASVLSILMISLPMVIISEIVYYFIYGKGDHKVVLYLGLGGNMPRIILYFVLPPLLGINGTATAWLIGSIVQMVFTVYYMNTQHLTLQYKSYAVMTIIPLFVGVVTLVVNLNFLISTAVIIIASLLLYVKIHLLDNKDVYNMLYAALPRKRAEQIFPYTSKLIKFIAR